MRNFVRHTIGILCGAWLSCAGADAGVHYGPHGGVIELPPGSYVCIVNDEATSRCLVRAIDESEIAVARDEDEDGHAAPVWMRTAFDTSSAQAMAAVGLPADNVLGLPGLMTTELSPEQEALVRCLAHTQLGRRLEQWNDPAVYQRGIVERCAAELHGATAGEAAVLPLSSRYLQEAAVIDVGMHRLADANRLYSGYAGRYARNMAELTSGSVLVGPPPMTSAMQSGYGIDGGNRIVVDLRPEAGDVCRALNLLHGRAWTALPDSLPVGARAGCYVTPKGYRFESQE